MALTKAMSLLCDRRSQMEALSAAMPGLLLKYTEKKDFEPADVAAADVLLPMLAGAHGPRSITPVVF